MPYFDEYPRIGLSHVLKYSELVPLQKKEGGAYSDVFIPVYSMNSSLDPKRTSLRRICPNQFHFILTSSS